MSASGENVGGVIGFLKTARWIVDMMKPKAVYVFWEGGGSTRKRAIFKEYKAHRKPERLNRVYRDEIPDTVNNRNYQLTLLVALLKCLPVCQIYVGDCEADDLIGYTSRYLFKGRSKVILSSDKDFYQLLDDTTKIFSPTSKSFVTPTDVIKRFSISPQNFCVAKAVCGDPSDNVPGIQGVGFKNIAKRFQQLGGDSVVSCEDVILEAIEQVGSSKKPLTIYKRIAQGSELIKRNWKLMYLDTQNLSGTQIKQLTHQVDSYIPKRDKMGMLRQVVKEGLNTFDADSLFYAFNCVVQ